ncbi:Fucosyl transferase family protein [Aphelenchoides avenae]|nr:Fucosyl transferase family protein [Aphelenchus avenae]
MTHRKDSDVFYPYDWFQPENGTGEALRESETWTEQEVLRRVMLKTEPVVQFVSNCKTWSKREAFVAELSKHINVTQYGACGDDSCPGKECLLEKIERYYFYLAFENSVCRDYVTEKFWTAVKNLVVPIVLSREVMDGIAPADSFIAVDDFNSTQELVARLNDLINNGDDYMKYFEWTKHYRRTPARLSPLCDLCRLVVKETKAIIPDIVHFWQDEGHCVPNYAEHLFHGRG